MEDVMKLKETGSSKKLPILGSTLTPEIIVGKLFSFHNRAHFFHLQTTSFSTHKNLDELYKDLVEAKDEISEYLLGIQSPKRFGNITIDSIGTYSDSALMAFLDEGFQFSVALCDYAEERTLEELCNMASDLQKLFVRSKYFTSLK